MTIQFLRPSEAYGRSAFDTKSVTKAVTKATKAVLRKGATFRSTTDSKIIAAPDLNGHALHTGLLAQPVPNAEVDVDGGVATSIENKLEGEAGQEMYAEAEGPRDNEIGNPDLEE
jgi:hypothetical protein